MYHINLFSSRIADVESTFRELLQSFPTMSFPESVRHTLFCDSTQSTYPPRTISTKKGDENRLRIQYAVAGFTEQNLSVTVEKNQLHVSGAIDESDSKDEYQTIGRGQLAYRSFDQSFNLPDNTRVEEVTLLDGILTIDLVREVPEEEKPKQIPINTGKSVSNDKVLLTENNP